MYLSEYNTAGLLQSANTFFFVCSKLSSESLFNIFSNPIKKIEISSHLAPFFKSHLLTSCFRWFQQKRTFTFGRTFCRAFDSPLSLSTTTAIPFSLSKEYAWKENEHNIHGQPGVLYHVSEMKTE